jgi:hypothetical protein
MDVPVQMFQDEHGQSMLHFAAARSHGRNALFQLLQEQDINVGYRDELYRTARDVAMQANLPDNVQDIDKWVLYMAARGKRNKDGWCTLTWLFFPVFVINCIVLFGGEPCPSL